MLSLASWFVPVLAALSSGAAISDASHPGTSNLALGPGDTVSVSCRELRPDRPTRPALLIVHLDSALAASSPGIRVVTRKRSAGQELRIQFSSNRTSSLCEPRTGAGELRIVGAQGELGLELTTAADSLRILVLKDVLGSRTPPDT